MLSLAGDDDEALTHLGRASDQYRALSDQAGATMCDFYAAGFLYGLGETDEAVPPLHQQACSMFDALGNDHMLNFAMTNLAEAFSSSGRVQDAINLGGAGSVLQGAHADGDTFVAAGVSTRQAEDLLELDEVDEALELLGEPARYWEERGNDVEQRRQLATRTEALFAKDHLAGAEEAATAALGRVEHADLPVVQARALAVLGKVALVRGEQPRAESLLAQAAGLRLAVGDVAEANALARLIHADPPKLARTRTGPSGTGLYLWLL
jgi:hypothetical protein